MRPRYRLAVYALVLAAVLAATTAAGGASAPVGLSNAEPQDEEHGSMGDGASVLPGLAAADGELRMVPAADTVAAGEPAVYRFQILDEDGPVVDYEIEHTKPMHLIVVRRDFVGFDHLHPKMQPDGTWTTTFTLAAPGAYRVFADFVVDGDKHTLGADLFVPGDFRPVELGAATATADAGDGYTVDLSGEIRTGEESALDFVVRRDGRVVDDIEEYLGARGHLVALRDGDLGYLHVHADEDHLRFEADFPTPGAYRLFLQFRHGGRIRTAAFTVDAEGENR